MLGFARGYTGFGMVDTGGDGDLETWGEGTVNTAQRAEEDGGPGPAPTNIRYCACGPALPTRHRAAVFLCSVLVLLLLAALVLCRCLLATAVKFSPNSLTSLQIIYLCTGVQF